MIKRHKKTSSQPAYIHIDDLDVDSVEWTIRFTVLAKGRVKTLGSGMSSTKILTILAGDESGIIKITFFNERAEYVDENIDVSVTCTFNGGSVIKENLKFAFTPCCLCIQDKKDSFLEICAEDVVPKSYDKTLSEITAADVLVCTTGRIDTPVYVERNSHKGVTLECWVCNSDVRIKLYWNMMKRIEFVHNDVISFQWLRVKKGNTMYFEGIDITAFKHAKSDGSTIPELTETSGDGPIVLNSFKDIKVPGAYLINALFMAISGHSEAYMCCSKESCTKKLQMTKRKQWFCQKCGAYFEEPSTALRLHVSRN